MKRIALLVTLTALSLVLFGCSQDNPTLPAATDNNDITLDLDKSAAASNAPTALYEVIIENITEATGMGSSQPFSPPILATHRNDMHLFTSGSAASAGIEAVAEDAMAGPLLDMLHNSDRVHAVAMGGRVLFPGGDTMRLEIEARPGARSLSMVFMLVNTNDAFGGLDGVKLPNKGEAIYWMKAYDAGTEVNSELMSDIPGPCCGSVGTGTDENGVVHHHMGIHGNGDLNAMTYGWEGPVAKVTVRRID